MPLTRDDLFAFLDALGFTHRTVTHPPLSSAWESRKLRGEIAGRDTRNLLLRAKGGGLFFLVVCDDAVLDLARVEQRLAAGRLALAPTTLLREHFGLEPGSVTPFAAINDSFARVTYVLDAALVREASLNFHPLDSAMTTTISGADLVKFLEATGHEPRILALSDEAAAGGT